MFTKYVPVVRVLNAATRQQAVRCMGGMPPSADEPEWKSDNKIAVELKSHMNNLPVPEGSWLESHKARNAKYNMQLGASVVFLVASVIAAYQSGSFFLNLAPPMKNKD